MQKFSQDSTLEKFLEFEDKYDLLKKDINGFYFWIYVRFKIINEIHKNLGELDEGQNNSKFGNNKKEKIINVIRLFIFSFLYILKFRFLKQKDILIVNHPRKIKNEYGKYECKYTHNLYEKIKNNSLMVEFPYPYKHFFPSNSDKILYLDWIRLYTTIYKKAKRKKYQISKENKLILKDIFNKIQEEYKIKFDIDKYIKYIEDLYISYNIEKKLIYKLLRKINPKKIIEVVYYSIDNLIINEIATELNIETIELQHGVMGVNHFAYNFKKKQNISQFPDKILTFSEFWKQTTRFPIKEENVIPVGFPYFERKVNKYKQSVDSEEKNGKKKILFISQASIGDKLVKLACELNKIIDKEKFEIIYKLHPGEFSIWKEKYKDLRINSIKTITNEIDLYELFLKSYVQVGVYSTAIYEGFGFGLDTYIYQIYGTDIFENLCKEGFATYINSAEELKKYLEKGKNNKKMNEEYLWKKDSLNNIIKEIEK